MADLKHQPTYFTKLRKLRQEIALLNKNVEENLSKRENYEKDVVATRKKMRSSLKYLSAMNHYLKKNLHARYFEKKLLVSHIEEERLKGNRFSEEKLIQMISLRLNNLKGTMDRFKKHADFKKFEDVLQEFRDENIFGNFV